MKASNFFTGCFFVGAFLQPADDCTAQFFATWALTLICFAAFAIATKRWEEQAEQRDKK